LRLILASQSSARRAMLTAAGVEYQAIITHVDEESATQALIAEQVTPRNLVDALAELKALRASLGHPADLCLGCDSIVVCADGSLLNKPQDRADAAAQLRALSGKKLLLMSAAVIAEQGCAVWRHVSTVTLQVRPLSDNFIESYLDSEWPAIAGCVGCFRVEALGVQLFRSINGDHFTILGMPLVEVLGYLRLRGLLAQ